MHQQLDLFPPQHTQEIIQGNCLDVMKTMADNSIDFVVTDPPYGLNFMGKHWDAETPNVDIWRETLRICKPGSMLAAFGSPRTHHHLMHALEQAGWEIRDVIMWLYASGFPKGFDIGKHNPAFEGYNTNLKPAYEPIILCMKPLDGTYAKNAQKWGVAGINIDDSRIGEESWYRPVSNVQSQIFSRFKNIPRQNNKGRWPANLIFDEEAAALLDEQSRDSGGASRFFYCAKASTSERNEGCGELTIKTVVEHRHGRYRCKKCTKLKLDHKPCICDDPQFERIETNQNNHPCVKPLALMRYLITLLAPPGSPTLLDPFCGSGSTLIAAKQLDIHAIGIELEKDYCEIATNRLK